MRSACRCRSRHGGARSASSASSRATSCGRSRRRREQALEDLAARAGPALENSRRYLEARRLADLDARTGLHNYRYFDETLEREVARARRYHRKLSLVVFDLDDFKQINDRIGPPDRQRRAGRRGRAHARGVAFRRTSPARYGGDEFAVILPESGVEEAEKFYERLRAHIAASPIPSVGVMGLSCGVGELESQEDWKTFFNRVDDALFRAKRAGKGQVVRALGGVGLISEEGSARPSPTSTIRTTDRRTTASRATGRSNAEGARAGPLDRFVVRVGRRYSPSRGESTSGTSSASPASCELAVSEPGSPPKSIPSDAEVDAGRAVDRSPRAPPALPRAA